MQPVEMNYDLQNETVDRAEYDWIKSENLRLKEQMQLLKEQNHKFMSSGKGGGDANALYK